MVQLILAILLALLCPNQTTNPNHDGKNPPITTMDDTGGETGNPPPNPPGGGKP